MIALVKPGDSTGYQTLQAFYSNYDATSGQSYRYVIEQREVAGSAATRATRSFYDGMGRKTQTDDPDMGGLELHLRCQSARFLASCGHIHNNPSRYTRLAWVLHFDGVGRSRSSAWRYWRGSWGVRAGFAQPLPRPY